MKRFYETKEYKFSELVDIYKKFAIPNFQRSYKWSAKQLTDFFSSVESNDVGYFIGNIVCVRPGTESENRLIIVDGQQRLTTISLFLVALRDVSLIYNDNNTVEEWASEYLKARDRKIRKEYYILETRKKSFRDVYESLVEGTHGAKRFDKAQYAYIRGYNILRELIEKNISGDPQLLEVLMDKVTGLQVVAIVLEADTDIFDTFEGLNSKGLGLSASDLIKNYLFSQAEKINCLESVELSWGEIEADFEKINPEWFPKFLRHVWIARNGYISGSGLFEVMKKKIKTYGNEANLLEYLEELKSDARFYLGVRDKRFSHYLIPIESLVRDVYEKFRVIDNQQVLEVLLALNARSQKDPNFKPKYSRDIAQLFWNYCFRMKYLAVSPSSYERIFAEYCKLIREAKSEEIINRSKDTFDKLKSLSRNKDEFVETFVSEISYQSDSKLIEFLLKEIIETREGKVITFTKTSIEHILPQEPKEWNLKKKDIKDYVHCIGNLTLLHPKDNEKAKNRAIAIKCAEIYDNSHFLFNREIEMKYRDLFVEDWMMAIDQRGKDIARELFDMTEVDMHRIR